MGTYCCLRSLAGNFRTIRRGIYWINQFMWEVPKVTEATALGAAMPAGLGAGSYDSIVNTAEELVVRDKDYMPNSENFSKYFEIKEQWQEVYANQLSLVDKGLTQSMWKAPGV